MTPTGQRDRELKVGAVFVMLSVPSGCVCTYGHLCMLMYVCAFINVSICMCFIALTSWSWLCFLRILTFMCVWKHSHMNVLQYVYLCVYLCMLLSLRYVLLVS